MHFLAEVDWDAIFKTGNMPFIGVFGMITIVGVAGVIGGCWMLVKKHRADVMLKRDLVSKGYSADEIERIISAVPKSGKTE